MPKTVRSSDFREELENTGRRGTESLWVALGRAGSEWWPQKGTRRHEMGGTGWVGGRSSEFGCSSFVTNISTRGWVCVVTVPDNSREPQKPRITEFSATEDHHYFGTLLCPVSRLL